jgi:hypothetical protein
MQQDRNVTSLTNRIVRHVVILIVAAVQIHKSGFSDTSEQRDEESVWQLSSLSTGQS